MRSALCKLLNIEKPILSAPMGGAAGPDLVAAVCNAGGFGVIPLWGKPIDEVKATIARVQRLTPRNFAVNLNMSFPYEEHLAACIEAGVFGVSLFWGLEPAAIKTAKTAGLVVMVSVGSAAEASIAEEAGADIIVAQGWEAGGHVWGRVATMALVPAVVDAVKVPVVAAGGIADGRGMAAALMLGASGVWVGTRFLASDEATVHDTYQRSILAASEDQTGWYEELYDVAWPDAPHRTLLNSTSQSWLDAGSPAIGTRPNENEVIGRSPTGESVMRYQSYTPLPGTTGDIEAMSLWAGQGVSLVRKTMPAAEIVEEIHQEALRALRSIRTDL
ncbi:nitronate monooxygenase [Sulfitobacter sp. F26204]|uniref:NAD(P)H-dependent flavin oxidoreductase n=1 Tax=Sulfitobacter sp. F26204 TaxID=2996014 RepID=UPI00225E1E71|nr:nitronate monooxygenase [Sulfitobacter sp. F26204]MCX7558841.1 nitronate monooxygenase [Sulfitobacter sp. F26204]